MLHGRYYVDVMDMEFVSSKLYGLELHKLKEFFARGHDLINMEVMMISMLILLKTAVDEAPFMLNAIREIF
jgi:hypothetical protein